MANRGDKSASRKTARDLPLTHRQQKRHNVTQRSQHETKGGSSSRHPRVALPSAASSTSASAPVLVEPRSKKAKRPTPPPTVTQAAAPKRTGAANAPAAQRHASAPNPPAKRTIASASRAPGVPVTPVTPRPVRPPRQRVAVSAPEAIVATPDTSRAHVAPVAPGDVPPQITVVQPGDTAPLSEGAVSDLGSDASLYTAALLAPPAEITQMAPAPQKPVRASSPTAHTAAATTPLGDASDDADDAVRALSAAHVHASAMDVMESATAPATDATSAGESSTTPPLPGAATSSARKMPTLAVMAALAQRPEPADTSSPVDRAHDRSNDATTPHMRKVSPTVPLADTARLDVAALDAISSVLDEPVAATPVAGESASLDLSPEALDMPAMSPAQSPTQSPTPSETQSAPLNASSLNTVIDDNEGTALERAAPSDADASDATRGPADMASQGLWWSQPVQRRAAPQTRPIASASPLDAPSDAEAEVTAPRPTSRRPAEAPTVSARSSAASDPRMTPSSQEPRSRSARQAWQARQDRAGRERDSLRAADMDDALPRRAQPTRKRARAMRSPRMVVLSWTAGGHVAVACVAALIAVIAALRSSAGPDALAVFNWALALALIAGIGAAAGYACAQTGRPRLATYMLALSQAGALAWALGLFGPRAALLMLAPAAAALALRGAGRLSAVVIACGWLLLFIVDEALTLTGALTPTLPLSGVGAALLDVALPLVGIWLAVSILTSIYTSRLNVVSRGRAVEHAALLTEAQLNRLRTQTEDDADALRRALGEALRGEQPERVYARGALSVVADEVNRVADQLVDLRHDRAERKRLESAARRLTRVMERAWLGLSWSWPDATGTILDDLLALLRTPPPPDTPDLLDDTTPTGQVVAPHLFRGWQAPEPDLAAPRPPSVPSVPSMPSLPSLWPSDPGPGLIDPLELPPSPRWRSPDSLVDS